MNSATTFKDIKAIFFDTADTMYANEAMEAAYPQKLVELLAMTRGISVDEAKTLLQQTSEKLKATNGHVTKVRTMAELGFSRAQVHEAFCKVKPSDFLDIDKELDWIMAQLQKEYKLGIISNFKRSHILEILTALGVAPERFTLLVTEDIVKEIKPDPEPFLKAVELSDYQANECLYVGDSPTKDMQPASQVGMATVLVGDSIPEAQAQYINAIIPDIKKITSLLSVS